jgi:hypothetical protein
VKGARNGFAALVLGSCVCREVIPKANFGRVTFGCSAKGAVFLGMAALVACNMLGSPLDVGHEISSLSNEISEP